MELHTFDSPATTPSWLPQEIERDKNPDWIEAGLSNLEPKMMHNGLLGASSAKLNLCPVRAFISLLTIATLYHAIMEELHADDPLCNKLENWELRDFESLASRKAHGNDGESPRGDQSRKDNTVPSYYTICTSFLLQ